jgi:hypothetical protein
VEFVIAGNGSPCELLNAKQIPPLRYGMTSKKGNDKQESATAGTGWFRAN